MSIAGALLVLLVIDSGRAGEGSSPGTSEPWGGPLTTQWHRDVGRSIVAPIQLHGDQLIVTTTDRRILSLDLRTGKRLWRRRFKEEIPVAPAVISQGQPQGAVVLYHGRPDGGRLRCLDGATGKDLWDLPWPRRPIHLAGDHERVWILGHHGTLSCRKLADGAREWEVEGFGWGSPAFVAAGDRLFVLERADSLHALAVDTGARIWSIGVSGRYAAAPSFFEGRLEIVSTTGTLLRIDPESGEIAGRWQRSAYQLNTPAHAEGRIVTAASGGRVEARDDLGSGWTFEVGQALESAPVPTGPVILLGTSKGDLLALRSDRGELAWSLDLKARFKVAPIVTERYLVLATHTGDIYVYQHGS